jgi:hypothetical protein
MTTVTDPLGSPTVFYNKSGIVYLELQCSSTEAHTPTIIPHLSGTTLLKLTRAIQSGASAGFKLDSGFEIGDVIEIRCPEPGASMPLYDSEDTLLFSISNNMYLRMILDGWLKIPD